MLVVGPKPSVRPKLPKTYGLVTTKENKHSNGNMDGGGSKMISRPRKKILKSYSDILRLKANRFVADTMFEGRMFQYNGKR